MSASADAATRTPLSTTFSGDNVDATNREKVTKSSLVNRIATKLELDLQTVLMMAK